MTLRYLFLAYFGFFSLVCHAKGASVDNFDNKVHKSLMMRVVDTKDDRRIQLQSINQCASYSQGPYLQGASCGYHALRNGICVAQGLLDGNLPKYSEVLGSCQEASRLFGTKGAPWRHIIMKHRFKSVIRRAFRKQIVDALTLPGAGYHQEYELLERCIRDLNPEAVGTTHTLSQGFRYEVSKKAIFAALSARMNKMISQGVSKDISLDVLKKLAAQKDFSRYLPHVAVDFTVSFEGKCSGKGVGFKADVDAYGQWLQSSEVPVLVESLRADGLLRSEAIIATYGDNLGGSDADAYASQEFAELYHRFYELGENCVGVVLVYLPGGMSKKSPSLTRKVYNWFGSWFRSSQESSFSGDAQGILRSQDRGHWITLVASRLKGETNYYVLDSLGNTPRLRNARISSVIDILDGKKRLPGYEWTKMQMDQVKAHSGAPKSTYSWKKIMLCAAGTCGLGYGLYFLCNKYKLFS